MSHTDSRAYRTAEAMGARVARATGVTVEVEHVGGGNYAAVAERADGRIVVVVEEGCAMYADRDAWENGDAATAVGGDMDNMFRTVADAALWIGGADAVAAVDDAADTVTVTVTREQAAFLYSLADIAADDPETWEDIHPNVDADDVRNAIDAAMRR